MSKGGGGGTPQTHVSSFFDPFFDADASDGDVLDLDGDNEMLFGYLTLLAANYRAVVFKGFDIHRSQFTSGFRVSVVSTSLKTSILKNSGSNFLCSFCQVVGLFFFWYHTH